MGKNENKGGNENENKVIDIFDAQLMAHGGDVMEWARRKMAENDAFCGIQMNEENMQRFASLAEWGKRACDLDHALDIKIVPPLNKERNGTVQITFPSPVFIFPDVTKIMSMLFALADVSSIAATADDGSGCLLVSFTVTNIWEG